MKKLLRVFWMLLFMLVLLTGMAAAEENEDTTTVEEKTKASLSEDGNYYIFGRMIDLTESMTAEERMEVNHYIIQFIESTECDITLYMIKSVESFGYASVDEFADNYYYSETYPYGYGEGGDCVFFVYEQEKNELSMVYFGDIPRISTWAVMKAKWYFNYYLRSNDAYDGAIGVIDRIWRDLEEYHPYTEPVSNKMSATWFVPFHDEKIDRLLDFSRLIPDEDTDSVKARLAELRRKYGVDVIVLTAPDSDGLDAEAFNDDFYDYGGFGVGEERTGIILFVRMGPTSADRFYTISTCGYAIDYFEKDDIEHIYDEMLPDFRNGRYDRGIMLCLDLIEKQLKHVIEPEEFAGVLKEDIKKRPNADRVVDLADVLSDSQIDKLETRIEKIRDKFHTDVLVLTADDLDGYAPEDYLRYYYKYKGYGEGDTRSGVAILITKDRADRGTIQAYGKAAKLFDEKALNRLSSLVYGSLTSKRDYGSAMDTFVRKVGFFAQWKHFPMQTSTFVVFLVIVWLIVTTMAKVKKASNKTISRALSAGQYVEPGSYVVNSVNEVFLNSKVTKQRRPEPSSSGGSSRGGGGGTHHSSSGTSHGGGGGRHF